MKLILHSFNSDVPPEKVCQPGVEYQSLETEVGPNEACAFFDQLVYPRDSFYLEVPECSLEFWKHEQAIWVEITSAEFWATSEVNDNEAQLIIDTLYRGGVFGSHIPKTSREWDAYSLLGEKNLLTTPQSNTRLERTRLE
jgi:hypothetical protein